MLSKNVVHVQWPPCFASWSLRGRFSGVYCPWFLCWNEFVVGGARFELATNWLKANTFLNFAHYSRSVTGGTVFSSRSANTFSVTILHLTNVREAGG